MCEHPESSDESVHLSSLARTFATPIQNISAFKSHRQFRPVCASNESSDECAHLSSLARAFATPIQNISAFIEDKNTQSTVVFMAVLVHVTNAQSLRITAVSVEPLSRQYI